MFDSPPARRTRRKLADKKRTRRSLSADCAPSSSDSDAESKHRSAMAPPSSDKVDYKAIEECVKKYLAKENVVDALASKLSKQIKHAVQEAVEASLGPLNAEVNRLKEQVTELTELVKRLDWQMKSKTDDLQQYQRRNNVRVFGIPEAQGEDTDELVVGLCKDRLGIDLPVAAICRSHRVGNKSQPPHPDGRPRHRPIIVKFISYRDRHRVFAQKKKLKGTGIVIREDLTAVRLQVFKKAAEVHGARRTWTSDGRVMWIDGDGGRGTATRLEDLDLPGRSVQSAGDRS